LKVILVATLIAAASAIEITGQAQYDEVTAGKASFVKFLAPW